MLIAKLAQCDHEFGRGYVETAFTLHRLEDDRRHALGIDVDLEEQVQ
ncbi:hypothetical protein D556_2799 [Bordetella holmesii 41130]|nr:hypothetical protein D556_2799 [Bordetella holmesii 41130]